MRIGLIGDFHGNLVALDAVLDAVAAERPDQIVCLGDLASTGPHPHEVISRVLALGCPTVQGNWDAWMVDVRAGSRSYSDCRAIDRWGAEQLSDNDLAYLSSLPFSLEIPLDSHATLLCFHGTPRSYDECIDAVTPDAELLQMLDGRSAPVIAYGHTHTQLLRRIEDGYLVNPGSVSECWNYTARPGETLHSPWAEYGIVDWSASHLNVSLRHVPIDVDEVLRGSLAVEMIGAAEWNALWLRGYPPRLPEPPS